MIDADGCETLTCLTAKLLKQVAENEKFFSHNKSDIPRLTALSK